ncbi:MAG TPA: rRNA pseudouridine synthase [Firmicutes bacterium]|nr:rRNA pseudouridine synthase [Bacillota bacterium]
MGDIRLQKLLSECGVASRRRAEEWIAKGKVKVNGHVAVLGDKADPYKDIVTVDGRRVARPGRPRYILLNKPRGVVATLHDERGRRCVADLVKEADARLFPVGRLDRDSEGLLLMTNDGDFANAIIHPAGHLPKVYRVTVRPGLTDDQLQQFCSGMLLEGESRPTAPADAVVLSREKLPEGDGEGERVVVQVTLYEGRNRQIRRMFAQLGLEVARLRRVALGPVKLGMLAPGKWRELEPREVQALLRAANKGRGKPTREGGAAR